MTVKYWQLLHIKKKFGKYSAPTLIENTLCSATEINTTALFSAGVQSAEIKMFLLPFQASEYENSQAWCNTS